MSDPVAAPTPPDETRPTAGERRPIVPHRRYHRPACLPPRAAPRLVEAAREALYWLGGYASSPEERRAAQLLERAVREAAAPDGLMPVSPESREVVR